MELKPSIHAVGQDMGKLRWQSRMPETFYMNSYSSTALRP